MKKTARSYASSITTFYFFVTLVVVQVALHPLVPLSAMLQDKEIDLIEAVTERTDPIEMMMYTGTICFRKLL